MLFLSNSWIYAFPSFGSFQFQIGWHLYQLNNRKKKHWLVWKKVVKQSIKSKTYTILYERTILRNFTKYENFYLWLKCRNFIFVPSFKLSGKRNIQSLLWVESFTISLGKTLKFTSKTEALLVFKLLNLLTLKVYIFLFQYFWEFTVKRT